MSRKLFSALALVIAVTGSRRAAADEWGDNGKAEVFSAHRRHVLVVEPDTGEEFRPGHCLATLFRLEGDKRTHVWSRFLINNDGPVRAFVADSGDYVVTMDEWGRVGELPVVIYGPKGALIRVHSAESLGLKDDLHHVRLTVSSFWWNEDSVSFFDPGEVRFLIRLHWGKWIVLDLAEGDVLKKRKRSDFPEDEEYEEHRKMWDGIKASRQKELEVRSLELLKSGKADERATGARVCGQEKFTGAAPRLRELLADGEYYRSNQPEWTRVYPVRQAAKRALEALGEKVEGVVVEEPDE